MTDDDLTTREKDLFQLMADGVIIYLGRHPTNLSLFTCALRIDSEVAIYHAQSKISPLDAYTQAVAYITAAALEGKRVYSAEAAKKRARLKL